MNSKRKTKSENLKPWKKDQSGNPAGRPPIEKTFSTAAREMLKAQEITISWAVGYAQKQRTLKAAPSFNHVLAAVLIMEGLDGNVRAISELLDRAEGRPAQTVFETRMMDFPNEETVMDWIDANQLARRNLTADQFKLALGRRYNRTKTKQGGDRRSKDQIDTLKNTSNTLAKEYGVSEKTVRNARAQIQSRRREGSAENRNRLF